MSESVIHAERLTRRFGDVLAVDRLDLDVRRGEVLGFLGPNGAGKTTTMRMLAGLIAPSEGDATVAGVDVRADPAAVRGRVGILTESPGLYERLSAERNLRFYAEMYGVRDVAGQVEKYLRLLGLWDRRRDAAGSFSKGMKQKLSIARALVHEPELVFLDEPTSALDPASARVVRDFIAALAGEGRTIFLCTHNLEEADRLCDRVALFRSRLLVLDTSDALRAAVYGNETVFELDRDATPFVATIQSLPFGPEVVARANHLVVRCQEPETNNPLLVRALVEAGVGVRYVRAVEHSLERVYLELVQQAEAEERERSARETPS